MARPSPIDQQAMLIPSDVVAYWMRGSICISYRKAVGRLAIGGWLLARYGRGRHPAGLNFGDLFAYALARATGEDLLFKGDDFAKTDLAQD